MKKKVTSLLDIKKIIQQTLKENSLIKFPAITIIILKKYIVPYIFTNLLYIFIKKNKNSKPTIGFSNLYYNGHPRAIFEYILKHKKDNYEIFWIAMNSRTIKDVRKAGGTAFKINGLLGIPYFLKTDLWVVAHKGRDIPFLPHKDYKIIQLWHSSVGMKGIKHFKEDFEFYDNWLVSSEFSKKRYMELWNAPENKLSVTGSARTDTLYNYFKIPKEQLLDELNIQRGSKIIFYVPTFDSGLYPWNNQYLEFEKLCNFCKKNKIILVLRLHPYAKINRRKLRKIIENFENVYWLDMSIEPEEMKLLAVADILITDWSSLHVEYYLTKRPIIYLEANKEFFSKKRGVDGKNVLPLEDRAGQIAHNSDELYQALKIVLKEGNKYREKQEKISKKVFGVIDGKASERAVKVMKKMLNEK